MSDLQLAHRLHERLVSQGVAYDIHDPRFEPEEADETGCILDWRPGKIVYKSVANGSRVPLFLKFFKRCSERRTCAVCTRSKIEIQYQSVEYWRRLAKVSKEIGCGRSLYSRLQKLYSAATISISVVSAFRGIFHRCWKQEVLHLVIG